MIDGIPAAIAARFTVEEMDRLVTLRRDLHRHPELSWREERTAGVLAEPLATTTAPASRLDRSRNVRGDCAEAPRSDICY